MAAALLDARVRPVEERGAAEAAGNQAPFPGATAGTGAPAVTAAGAGRPSGPVVAGARAMASAAAAVRRVHPDARQPLAGSDFQSAPAAPGQGLQADARGPAVVAAQAVPVRFLDLRPSSEASAELRGPSVTAPRFAAPGEGWTHRGQPARPSWFRALGRRSMVPPIPAEEPMRAPVFPRPRVPSGSRVPLPVPAASAAAPGPVRLQREVLPAPAAAPAAWRSSRAAVAAMRERLAWAAPASFHPVSFPSRGRGNRQTTHSTGR